MGAARSSCRASRYVGAAFELGLSERASPGIAPVSRRGAGGHDMQYGLESEVTGMPLNFWNYRVLVKNSESLPARFWELSGCREVHMHKERAGHRSFRV